MKDEQLLRYSRQIMLPEFDIKGQQKLLNSTILLIGLGGLGSPVSMYLASAGVGHLILVDFDSVELSNLQRQIVHSTNDLNRAKVESAKERLLALNPDCKITTINKQLDEKDLLQQTKIANVVIDGSDNFATRFAVNKACHDTKTPLVSGAAIRFEGQLSVFDHRDSNAPCYRCLYNDDEFSDETCSQTGVIAPLLGIIGSMQALETIKLITNIGKTLIGQLMLFDATTSEFQTMKYKKDPDCPVCGSS
ncbi:MAG: ThiF family adenylyltransferase [Gammaproteobacteria bacterium]